MRKVTKDKALIFSAVILLAYIVVCEIQLFMGIQLDPQLTIAVFATFGVAEGGYCAYLHKVKKDRERAENEDTDVM